MSHHDPKDDALERARQRTVLLPGRAQGNELPAGHALQEFVIEQVLGVGSSSIVYVAADTKLNRRVALKEYLPGTLAVRAPSGDVSPRVPRFAEAYDKGLQSFINEARLLGSFDHAALVKVYRFWPAHGTAYMAMPYYDGITLKKWLADLGAPPSETWLRQLAQALTQALAVLHEHSCLHRDVAPDNVVMLYDRSAGNYLQQAPRPVLLDFGAARHVVANATQNLTALLKSGYSPIEQYAGEGGLKQGPWTDVYAVCAVLYTAAIGRAPNAAIARVVRDDMPSARSAGQGRYSQAFLAAIDAGLALRPEQRPQSMAELQDWFSRPDPAEPSAPLPAQADLDLPLEAPPLPALAPSPRPRLALWAGLAVAALLVLVLALAWAGRIG
jgi:serine/threonine protein kinase